MLTKYRLPSVVVGSGSGLGFRVRVRVLGVRVRGSSLELGIVGVSPG